MAPRNGQVLVLDNGAGTCKLGLGGESAPRRVFPNCVAKPKGERQAYIGDMLLDSKEISQLTIRRPFDRGYLINWDLEREIWGYAFKTVLGLGRPGSGLSVADCGLCATIPMFNFPSIQAATEQVVFEEFRFNSFFSAPAPVFSLQRMASANSNLPAVQAGAGIVVDAGFSFMHVVPFFDWQPINQGVRRIDVGGKALTNYMKELVSYRSLNMMDETYLMECVKEQVCFVSKDVRLDLKLASMRNSPHRREFVLPDGVSNFRGYIKPIEAAKTSTAESSAPAQNTGQGASGMPGKPGGPQRTATAAANAPDQALILNNERFMVPEVAFHPRDIGLNQAGIAEAVTQAVNAISPALHSLVYNNVVLTGGLASCPGFKERFIQELQPLVPDNMALGVHVPNDPITCAWEGMSTFVSNGQYQSCAMTRAQYEETGGSTGRGSR